MSVRKPVNRTAVYELKLRRARTIAWPLAESATQTQEAVTIARAMIGSKDCEHFLILMIGPRCEIIGTHVAAIGRLHGVSVALRDVFKAPILANASGIVLAHNHPSGDPTPSVEDRAFTERAVQIGAALGLPIVDHVIVTPAGAAFSFHAEGLL